MKISDVRRSLSKLLGEKTGLRVYSEEINKLNRPCIYIQLVDVNKQSLSNYREKRTISFDLIYFPSSDINSCNNEIQDKLDEFGLCFIDKYGNKSLKVLDRSVTLSSVTENIVDDLGHFMFNLEFIQSFGTRESVEDMQEIILEL